MIDVKIIKKSRGQVPQSGAGGGISQSSLATALRSLSGLNATLARLLVPVDASGNELTWTEASQPNGGGGIRAVALKAKVDLFSTGNVAAFGLEDAGDDPGNTGGGGGSCDCEAVPVAELRAAVIAILEGYGGAWEPGGVLPPPTCDCEELSELEVDEVINKNFK